MDLALGRHDMQYRITPTPIMRNAGASLKPWITDHHSPSVTKGVGKNPNEQSKALRLSIWHLN
jgi:hypothetical protein